MEDRNPSEVIKEFLGCMKSYSEDYEICKAIVAEEDAKTQDFLHALEFQKNNKDRSKIATIIHLSREKRRKAKDRMELIERTVMFFRKEQTKMIVKSLKTLIADQEREEKRINGIRTYSPRTSVWDEFQPCPLCCKGGDDNDNS